MARISKPGLDYFPLDVNFLQDRKVRRISCRHHAAGIAALTSLLCLIYKEKGYYISWNKDTLFDIAQEACCGEEEMQAIIDDCLAVGLFDDLIYKEYGVLTSQAIQEQYHKIITDSRRKYKLPLEHFWLIKEDFKDVTESHDFATTMPQTKEETDTDETETREDIVGLVIPDNVKTIGTEAFSEYDISYITLENGVEFIEDYAFEGCGLKDENDNWYAVVYVKRDNIHISDKAFAGGESVRIVMEK